MKSVASFILAAVVSAEYCYEDGCNCNGEARACYSVPRQNMKPKAINTCCAEGDMPTIYGRDNGRSVNITPVTDSLGYGNNQNAWGNEQKSSLNWTNAKCRNYCDTTGAYPPMGCGQMTSPLSPYAEPCAPLAAVTESLWSNAKQQEMLAKSQGIDTTESQTASLRWNEWKCVNYCVQFGNYPPGVSKCPKFGDCQEHIAATQVTASLKKDGNWNDNTFTGLDYEGGGNTNCGANCGITVNVNKLDHAMTGGSSATWSPTASLAWNADKCSAYCGTFGSYPPTKCERYGPCEVAPTVEAAPVETVQTSNLACPCPGKACISNFRQYDCRL